MTRVRIITALAVLALVGAAFFYWRQDTLRPRDEPVSLSRGAYIWQYNWGVEVAEAVEQHAAAFDGLFPFVAELDVDRGVYSVQRGKIAWSVLSHTDKPVWAVIRGRTRLLGNDAPADVPQHLVELAQSVLAEAHQGSVALAGVQFDIDAPTDRLGVYADWMTAIREGLESLPVSITTLPDWLRSPDFGRLVNGLDHFVLQVHGLGRDAKGNPSLMDAARVPGWIARASRVGTPFFVALPTYGHSGTNGAAIFPDTDALATIVARLQGQPPPNCHGVLWFRLPVSTDSLNWPWETLAEVMEGHAPPRAFHVELSEARAGVFEARVYNDCGRATGGRVRFAIHWPGATLRAHDLLGGAREETDPQKDGMIVLVPAPPPGAPRLAAWFALKMEDGSTPQMPMADTVEWTQ